MPTAAVIDAVLTAILDHPERAPAIAQWAADPANLEALADGEGPELNELGEWPEVYAAEPAAD